MGDSKDTWNPQAGTGIREKRWEAVWISVLNTASLPHW